MTLWAYLTTLTQKCIKFKWADKCEKSFQMPKHRLTLTNVFTILLGTNGFVVYCDASRVGLCCILMKHDKVVAYVSF